MTIGVKILCILAIPFLGFLTLAGIKIAADQRSWQAGQQTVRVAQTESRISVLIHQFQLERGLTSGFLTSRGLHFGPELASQRPHTDGALGAASELRELPSSLPDLGSLRKSVDGLQIPVGLALDTYTSGIQGLLDQVAVEATKAPNQESSQELTAYFFFLNVKELNGQLRALLNGGLSAGHFDPAVEQRLVAVLASRVQAQRNFERFATADEQAVVTTILADPAVARAETLVTAVIQAPPSGPFSADAATVFGALTAKINVMKQADDALAARLQTHAATAAGQALTFLMVDGVAVLGLLALALILQLGLSRSIRHQLGCEPAEVAALARSIQAGILEAPQLRPGKVEGAYADLRQMVQSLVDRAEALEQIEHGNLTQAVTLSSDQDRLGLSLQTMNAALRKTVLQVRESVDQLRTGADQVAQASQVLAQGATEQASAVEELNATAAEVASKANRNANEARAATKKAQQARQDASEGKQVMTGLLRLVESMASSSTETKRLVKTIDDIAFQVNVLALNAAVEAARAGKVGKGFAVVAEEVRQLAGRSASAVEETTRIVDQIQGSIASVIDTARLTDQKLETIAAGAGEVAATLDGIVAESLSQAQSLVQMKNGLDQIEQVTQSNTASAEQSASAAEELASQTSELGVQVSWFQT